MQPPQLSTPIENRVPGEGLDAHWDRPAPRLLAQKSEDMDASQQPGSHSTCGDNDPPLVGGHVGRRGAVLLIHVAVVVHGVGLASTN